MELYKTINIDKTMYNRKGKSFSQVTEKEKASVRFLRSLTPAKITAAHLSESLMRSADSSKDLT